MSEDEDHPPSNGVSSNNEAYSVYGSMDGFIRPPPPRGPPRITVPFEEVVSDPAAQAPPAQDQAPRRQASAPGADHLVESLLASAQLSDTDVQLARQLFLVSGFFICYHYPARCSL